MSLTSVKKLLEKDLSDLEEQIKHRTETKIELINKLSEHIIASGGKRLRPILLTLSSYCKDEKLHENVINASVVIEFIHAATLLHDDVVDMSKFRHSKETANIIWGNKGAVLVGDFLYSRAFEIIVEINNSEIYEILAKTTNTISQGEVIQLMNLNNIEMTEELYLEIIYRKTAILFEASTKIGGILSKNNKKNTTSLSNFGLHFGLAYQLRNDYLDYFGDQGDTGKNITEDLSEGKVTMPIIHSLKYATDKDKQVIIEAFTTSDTSKKDSIISILTKTKSDIYMQNIIEKETDLANQFLSNLNNSKFSESLKDLATFCKDRIK